ncbi:PDZ/DHR/GLGF domain protein [Ancylostoma caninum]|uniref:PDZ/DHR/GLGF domain protein n=1 Tax=Ancylostoma caninum TaxID=29170 RepID=A0A368H1F1_ANCCA|nr:PDZ/DHR/GLGF domain protein [Ancylostoma caninum]
MKWSDYLNIICFSYLVVFQAADPVFVAPPPPHEEPTMNKPRARLCKLEKSSQSEEFGFNLHAEKGRGHFIGTVDQGGIGDRAGLRMGQRIVGVNGVLVYPNTPHKEVVAQIKRSPLRTTLLVASEEVDRWYKENGAEYSFDYVEEETSSTHNQISPHSIHISDEEEFPQLRYKAPPQSPEDTDQIEVEEVHEIEYEHKESETHVSTVNEEPPEPAAMNEPSAEESADIMDQVFAALPQITTAGVIAEPAEPEVLEKTYELPPEDLEARPPADLVHHKETNSSTSKSSHSSHASAVDAAEPAPHYVPTYQPQRQEPSQPAQVSPPSNGSSLNGYPTSTDSVSPIVDKFDIFGLSAQEARERLRQNKKNIHRGFDMSLEEKYRLVSNM